MNNKFNTSVLAIITALTLSACGGGDSGGSSPDSGNGGGVTPTPTNAKVAGLAIDGYVEGATAFLDYNFNGVMDENEPRSLTDQNGRFEFEVAEDMVECKNYSPIIIDVPAGAYDSDYGVVVDPYRLSFPPAFSSDNVSGADLFATTPFTSVIWGAIEVDLKQRGVADCQELMGNKELQSNIISQVAQQEWELGNRYNIPADELYADFIANGNTHQHALAQKLTTGLSASYAATVALKDANPNAWHVTVEFYVEEDDSGFFTKWYREEKVITKDGHEMSLYSVDEDLVTTIALIEKNVSVRVASGDVLKNRQDLVNYLPDLGKYACGLSTEYKENQEVFGNDTVSFLVSASALVDTAAACDSPLVYNSAVPNAVVFRTLTDANGSAIQMGQWGFDYGKDAIIDGLMNDGIYADIPLAELIPFRTWDFSLDSVETYAADRWTRSSVVNTEENVNLITEVNSDGVWMVRTTYPNGTHKVECGADLDSLVEVADMGQCYP